MLKKIIKLICYRLGKVLNVFNNTPEKVLNVFNNTPEKVLVSFNELEIIEELEKDMLFVNCYINDKSVN
jgi:hypothetical protein